MFLEKILSDRGVVVYNVHGGKLIEQYQWVPLAIEFSWDAFDIAHQEPDHVWVSPSRVFLDQHFIPLIRTANHAHKKLLIVSITEHSLLCQATQCKFGT